MLIRTAESDDAFGIAKVHVDSWRTTYEGIMPASFLNNLSYGKRTDLWKDNIAVKEDYVVVAVTDEGTIIGFGTASKRATNTVEKSGDLTSIYLLKEYQGQGIGKMLLKELFLHFKQLDYERIFVEVLEANETKYFYEYYGAELIKTVEIKIDGTLLKELVYEWKNIDALLEKII
ncbi:GNAT family N-acetyltransferase [uncultured Planococcus sp.]|uniref:GNAT family N-acetyltransferase n=1 Tax=Planococcus donghaensis TaxID=414778 RepID=UPI002622F3BE|nr:GNAT family N-acetyltransferase [uncultured Planococcus sp.]